MSLFKLCSCWSVQCADILDNYDSSSLICQRFGLTENEKDYIIVGSHSGHLSIFYPNCEINSDGYFQEYKPTDLILETKLSAPILCVLIGKFSGTIKNENTNQLAILHPYSLAIYNVILIDGVAEHGKQCSLQLLTTHKFNRTGFSMCKGTFGRTKIREFICVTHMDGTLTFYEQDGISYECCLPGPKALPSVLAYIQRTDSFVRVNFCWELESFSYQELSQSSENNQMTNQLNITPSWSICLGEFITDICPVQVTNTRTSIMILGEHDLISISDEGRFQFIIKLDYSPKCFYSFVVGWYWEPNARLITAIVSESLSLLIYDETKLIWATQLQELPIAIQRSNLHNLPGCIVTLSANGLLNVGYLGSEPFMFKVPPLNLQEMHFEKAHNELLNLEKDIKQGIDLTDAEMINTLTKENLELKFIVFPKVVKLNISTISTDSDNNIQSTGNDDDDDDDCNNLMCFGEIEYNAKSSFQQIQIQFKYADGIICSQPIITINDIVANSLGKYELKFYLEKNLHICTTEIEAIVSSINNQSVPRVQILNSFLPLNLLYKKCSGQKDAAIKLTFTINIKNLEAFRISSIFSEIYQNDIDSDVQALGLSLRNTDEVVTIVAAKNSNRFRIQSDCLEVIPVILEKIIRFLKSLESNENATSKLITTEATYTQKDGKTRKGKKRITKKKSKELLMEIPINFPSKEIMLRIDSHHNVQDEIRTNTALMDLLWNQFKLFQRSLQSKTENDPVDGLMMLIEKNYDDLVKEGDKLMVIRNDERSKRCDLSCAIALCKHLITCLKLDDEIFDLIKLIFIYPVEDWIEKSWEETLDSSLNVLHNYGPLCRNKTENNILDGHHLSSVSSTIGHFEYERFKRHMMSLFDRVCRLATINSKQKQKNDLFIRDSINIKSISNEQSNNAKDDDEHLKSFHESENGKINESILNNNNNNNNRLETLPDNDGDDINENDEIENSNDNDLDLDLDKTQESNWLSSDIPPTEIMMLKTKRN